MANIIMEGRYGGPQVRISAVAGKLKRHGIETIVVIPKHNSEFFYKKLFEDGIQVRQMRLHRLSKRRSDFIKFFILFVYELFSLYKMIKKEQIDIVHCNGSWQIKGIIAGRLAGAMVVWHLNDTDMPAFVRFIFKFVALNFCDSFINSGKRVKTYYLRDPRFSKKQMVEIQAPVDTSIFNPQIVKADQKIACFDGLKIVTVGNINPNKGLNYFIEMANILNSKYNNLYFYIVGSHLDSQKHYSEKLTQMICKYNLKNVYFYGHCDNVPGILKGTDIYVCSSIREASPMSVWEAMAMEKAIVTTDVGDVNIYIKNGNNGFVVQQGDATAIAEKVSILIENKELRDKFGKRARVTAVKKLDIKICVDKIRSFYLEVLGM